MNSRGSPNHSCSCQAAPSRSDPPYYWLLRTQGMRMVSKINANSVRTGADMAQTAPVLRACGTQN